MSSHKTPMVFDLSENGPPPDPSQAPPVPDPDALPEATDLHGQGRAMASAARLASRRGSWVGRAFWSVALGLLSVVTGIAAWEYATGLMARMPLLGMIVTGLAALLGLLALAVALRELSALARLRRIDGIQRRARAAISEGQLAPARAVAEEIVALYAHRKDLRWGERSVSEQLSEQFDADAVLHLCEDQLLAPLDARAVQEIEGAARQVATVTALVPLALADVIAALTANLRMIRRIAEIYGGRGGMFGSWRLTRVVMTHLVATGAVAAGDDLVGTLAGGGILAKLSRRFGEGLVNGALTARVGLAALEVCRPLPFVSQERPSTSHIVRRALAGLFQSAD